MLDTYLWNDQTELVRDIFEGLDEKYPEVERWYEIKYGLPMMRAAGAAVIEWGVHAWLGCPRNREVCEYLHSIVG